MAIVPEAQAAEMHQKAISCHNQFHEDPVIIATPGLVDQQTIAEIEKRLRKRGVFSGPITGRIDEAARSALDHSSGV